MTTIAVIAIPCKVLLQQLGLAKLVRKDWFYVFVSNNHVVSAFALLCGVQNHCSLAVSSRGA
jgi:hypothetical protein